MDNTHLESINFLTDIIQKCNIIDYNSDLQTLTDFARFSHISRCNYALVHFFLSVKEIHYFFLYPSITRQIQFYRTHSYISMPISVVRLRNQIRKGHFLQCSTLPNSSFYLRSNHDGLSGRYCIDTILKQMNTQMSAALIISLERFHWLKNRLSIKKLESFFNFSVHEKILIDRQISLFNHKVMIDCQKSVKSFQKRRFFQSVFSYIWTKYGDLLSKSPYSVQIQENTKQKKLRIGTLFTQ